MGKAPLTCHCEAPQEPWQSRSTRRNTGKPRRIRKCLFEIAASGLRHPRNDTGGRHSQVCPCAPPGEAGYQICHCEAPQEPWQSRSTRLEHRKAPAKSQLPPRDSHVASLLGMTNLGALRGRRSHSITCQPARRSLGAATDAIGWYVFIGTLYELEVPSRDCHVGLRPPRNDTGGRRLQACQCAPPDVAGPQICHCEAPQEPRCRPSRRERPGAIAISAPFPLFLIFSALFAGC